VLSLRDERKDKQRSEPGRDAAQGWVFEGRGKHRTQDIRGLQWAGQACLLGL
jgi:hypothetical protein